MNKKRIKFIRNTYFIAFYSGVILVVFGVIFFVICIMNNDSIPILPLLPFAGGSFILIFLKFFKDQLGKNACVFFGHKYNKCKCIKCGHIENLMHNWNDYCLCPICGMSQHDYDGCKCIKCGNISEYNHDWNKKVCTKCGTVCINPKGIYYGRNQLSAKSLQEYSIVERWCDKCDSVEKFKIVNCGSENFMEKCCKHELIYCDNCKTERYYFYDTNPYTDTTYMICDVCGGHLYN